LKFAYLWVIITSNIDKVFLIFGKANSMKKIKTVQYKILSLIFVILSTGHTIYTQSLLGGLFQFSKNTNLDLVNIIVCYCGKIIPTQKHTTGIPKITYEIPKYNDENKFYVLITPTAPNHVLKQYQAQEELQNTIDYLKVNDQEPYLFYTLELIEDAWVTTKSSLPESGQIPDNIIMITYFPHFIKAIKGGNNLELPTIFIDNSEIDIFGSEENFEDAIIRLQLSSLDLKALHVPTKQKIQADSCRVMIMDTIT
jgi:hypothetical protein